MMWFVLCTASVACVLAFACAWRVRRYRKWLKWPARRQDTLELVDCGPGLSVQIGVDGFALPAAAVGGGRTVLLVLELHSTLSGWLFDPHVEVRCGTLCRRQYFERGADGQRYVNLTDLCASGSAPQGFIVMRGRRLRWESAAKLLCFASPSLDAAEVLVVAPHPDDAEIAAFGVYAGHLASVVTLTAGERGSTDLSSVIDNPQEAARWRARLRVRDSLTIPQQAGIARARCVNLVFPDGELAALYRDPASSILPAAHDAAARASLRTLNPLPEFQAGTAPCTWDTLVAELRTALELWQPSILVCPHPLLDGHPDHVFASVALAAALAAMPGREPLVLMYVVHARGAELYPFGPAEAVSSVPPGSRDGPLADSIYSHSLTESQRRAKLFAVDAHSDLRQISTGAPRTLRAVLSTLAHELAAAFDGLGPNPAAFQRRAPRPNELYFVASRATFAQLVHRALSASEAR